MKTKPVKDETYKAEDEITKPGPKKRGRKKVQPIIPADDDNSKTEDSEADKSSTAKETAAIKTAIKKTPGRKPGPPRGRPVGIKKTLRNKKALLTKDKIKKVIRQVNTRTGKRGPKPKKLVAKDEGTLSQTNKSELKSEEIPLIPVAEIKKEPISLDEVSPSANSRASSPKTTPVTRRQRLSSDMKMMKNLLNDSPTNVPENRTPYRTRGGEGQDKPKNLRNGKQRKKDSLLNEIVKHEHKRRQLKTESGEKCNESLVDIGEDGKKPRRLRSYSRDGSEFSKSSDITESDLSFCDSNDAESLKITDIKNESKISKSKDEKTELEGEESMSVSEILNTSTDADSVNNDKDVDPENNNDGKDKLESKELMELGDEISVKSDLEAVSDKTVILNNMSKLFNEIPMRAKNIRRSRRQRNVTFGPKGQDTSSPTGEAPTAPNIDEIARNIKAEILDVSENADKESETDLSNVVTNNNVEAQSTSSLQPTPNQAVIQENVVGEAEVVENIKVDKIVPVGKFYGTEEPTSIKSDINLNITKSDVCQSSPKTEIRPVLTVENVRRISNTKEKSNTEAVTDAENYASPKKSDDSENLRLRFDEDDDSDKGEESVKEPAQTPYKTFSNQDIDKLMGKLKHFEELDKMRQQELRKANERPTMMVTEDVVLIPKSGTEAKPFKELQPKDLLLEKAKEKESVLSCFENNSAISISSVKRDQVRKSVDLTGNAITLIKRSGSTSRKQSTNSNPCRDSTDTISFLEKSLGKQVTLEIRKSLEKSPAVTVTPAVTPATVKPKPSVTVAATPRLSTEQLPVETLSTETKSTAQVSYQPPKQTAVSATPILPIGTQLPIITQLPIATQQPAATLPVATLPTKGRKSTELNVKKTSEPRKFSEVRKSSEARKSLESSIKIKPVEVKKKDEEKFVENAPKIDPELECATVTKNETTTAQETIVKDETIPKDELLENVVSPNAAISNLTETPESQLQKESILRTLGLLTLKAADEAKIEKQKQKEMLAIKNNKSSVNRMSGESYTGTLKTVIKLNRAGMPERRSRSPLKMTFQKSKGRNKVEKCSADCGSGGSESDENPVYTIHKDFGGSGTSEQHMGAHRKSHYSNRSNHEGALDPLADVPQETVPGKETASLVIPEKASSFSIHPGRLCQDQCYYCGGKFGLFDTPCHLAQMKSGDRQRKILDNEEKLTRDSCLCDACYRHVDRRANCPSYRKRPYPGAKPFGPPPYKVAPSTAAATCHAEGCVSVAEHSIKRKWLIKMRKSVNKVVQLELDYPGLHTIPLCRRHYQIIAHIMVCALCKRQLTKNHNIHFITQELEVLNPMLSELDVPVTLADRPVVCKLCRIYCTLLMKPAQQIHKRAFLKSHRRRLLQAHNIDLPEESESEGQDDVSLPDSDKDASQTNKDGSSTTTEENKDAQADKDDSQVNNDITHAGKDIKQKRKSKNGKTKNKKLLEGSRNADENSSESNSTVQGQDKDVKDVTEKSPQLNQDDEDIESLICSNKIRVAKNTQNDSAISTEVSDSSDIDMLTELDAPAMPTLDKQSELQYLLQKQNNPAQFLPKPPVSLTQKSRNVLKAHNASAINKPGHTQRVIDKNAKRIQKLGQIITQKPENAVVTKPQTKPATETSPPSELNTSADTVSAPSTPPSAEKPPISKDLSNLSILKNIALNDECTIETLPPKKAADINSLKNKWQMSESFIQVKKNLSELSKNLTPDQITTAKKNRPAVTATETAVKYSNPVKRLETNPSISVRELFPGEEEMSLQCSVDFNNVKGVTPEGWEKCNSTIQYDTETKKMWHDLQKPYGNQSSFLRHLILLEKYFRNGDLVLSQNANLNAATYSSSVQNRLRSYDNVPTNGDRAVTPTPLNPKPFSGSSSVTVSTAPPAPQPIPSTIMPETTITEYKKPESSTGVSLIEFRKQKPVTAGKSLLKTNLNQNQPLNIPKFAIPNKTMITAVRPSDNSTTVVQNQTHIMKASQMTLTPYNQAMDPSLMAGKSPRNILTIGSAAPTLPLEIISQTTIMPRPPTPKTNNEGEIMKPPLSLPPSMVIEPSKIVTPKQDAVVNKPKAPSLPPELIAINSQNLQGRTSIENVLKNIQQLAKGVPMTAPNYNASPITNAQAAMQQHNQGRQTPMHSGEGDAALLPPPAKKVKRCTKPWRPVLMKITAANLARIQREQLKKAVDGRLMPCLVQVLSGGKYFHITFEDYNKMCSMRMEKLAQIEIVELLKNVSANSGVTATNTSQTETMSDALSSMSMNTFSSDSLTVMQSSSAVCDRTLVSIGNGSDLTQPCVTVTEITSPITTPVKMAAKSDEKVEMLSPESNAVNILKNVGLRNITIAPIMSKMSEVKAVTTATVTSQSLLITPAPLKTLPMMPPMIPQLGPSVSVTTETQMKPTFNISSSSILPSTKLTSMVQSVSQTMVMPKIPKSLTVIPQTMGICVSDGGIMSAREVMTSAGIMTMSGVGHIRPCVGSMSTSGGLMGTSGGLMGTSGGLMGTSGGLMGTSGGLMGTSGGLMGTSGGLMGTSGGLMGTSGGLMGTSGGLMGTSGGLMGTNVSPNPSTTAYHNLPIPALSSAPPTSVTAPKP